METGLIIILSLVGLGILVLVVMQVLKYLKGSLKLIVDTTVLNPGDTVSGSVNLKIKKPVESKSLIVSLICQEERKTRDMKGNTKSSWVEVSRNEVSLDGAKSYPKGFSNSYNYSIVVPNRSLMHAAKDLVTGNMSDSQKAAVDKVAGVLNKVNNFTGNNRLKWKIVARLDCDGVDLTASKKIRVNSI